MALKIFHYNTEAIKFVNWRSSKSKAAAMWTHVELSAAAAATTTANILLNFLFQLTQTNISLPLLDRSLANFSN